MVPGTDARKGVAVSTCSATPLNEGVARASSTDHQSWSKPADRPNGLAGVELVKVENCQPFPTDDWPRSCGFSIAFARRTPILMVEEMAGVRSRCCHRSKCLSKRIVRRLHRRSPDALDRLGPRCNLDMRSTSTLYVWPTATSTPAILLHISMGVRTCGRLAGHRTRANRLWNALAILHFHQLLPPASPLRTVALVGPDW